MILAGDIGGTKTVLALYETGAELKLVRDDTFPSKENASLEDIIGKFFAGHDKPALKAGCFGVAAADFAARTDDEIELLRWLRHKFGHVSYERILSGPGFYNVFCCLRELGKYKESDALKEKLAAAGDPTAVAIAATQLGISGADPLS